MDINLHCFLLSTCRNLPRKERRKTRRGRRLPTTRLLALACFPLLLPRKTCRARPRRPGSSTIHEKSSHLRGIILRVPLQAASPLLRVLLALACLPAPLPLPPSPFRSLRLVLPPPTTRYLSSKRTTTTNAKSPRAKRPWRHVTYSGCDSREGRRSEWEEEGEWVWWSCPLPRANLFRTPSTCNRLGKAEFPGRRRAKGTAPPLSLRTGTYGNLMDGGREPGGGRRLMSRARRA